MGSELLLHSNSLTISSSHAVSSSQSFVTTLRTKLFELQADWRLQPSTSTRSLVEVDRRFSAVYCLHNRNSHMVSVASVRISTKPNIWR
jgi:hypothetical protein